MMACIEDSGVRDKLHQCLAWLDSDTRVTLDEVIEAYDRCLQGPLKQATSELVFGLLIALKHEKAENVASTVTMEEISCELLPIIQQLALRDLMVG